MSRQPPEIRPHILLITCHDLGRYLGCYGRDTLHTPHLDSLAAGGVRFDRAFATASGCSPSRAAIATGRYPHSNGVMGLAHHPFDWDLGPGERHIAEILGAAGYETHLFGFQHVSPDDDRLGFTHVHRTQGGAFGARVSAMVENLLQQPRPSRPLYLEVNLEEPHRPYLRGGATPDDSKGVSIPGYVPEDQAAREEMAAFQGSVRQADAGVGQILAALESAGLAENTLAVFTADHGISLPRAKCTLYDGGIEVALLLRWPQAGLPAGTVRSEMVSNVDLLPTLLEAAGAPAPPNLQGRSFLPLLLGGPYTSRDAIYAEKTYHSYYDAMRGIRTEQFKYIRNFETTFLVEVPGDVEVGAIFRTHVELYHGTQHPPAELYDLETDPLEQRNLAGNAEWAEVERGLDSRLWEWMAETADPLLEGPVPSPSYRRRIQRAPRAEDRPE